MSKEELEIISRRFEDKLAQLMPKEEFLPFVRCVVEEARLMVENAPTVDAVEVVRCKDCAYWGTKVVYANGERADCLNFNFVTPCEFFCKWGERRKDADT